MIRPKDNPFAAHRIDKLAYRFREDSLVDMKERLKQSSYRGAIVGPYGSGKTTLLEALSRDFKNNGYDVRCIFVNSDQRNFSWAQLGYVCRNCSVKTMVFIDGADWLPRWQWMLIKHFSKKGGGLIIACHRRDYLPVIKECTTSSAVLQDCLEELTGQTDGHLQQAGRILFKKHSGNIRNVFRELYFLAGQGEKKL